MYICEIVSSIRNKEKINIYGYMMLKDKNRNHRYYWYCEKCDILKCSERATTILTEDQHHLVKNSEHNHAAEASRVNVIKKINILKKRAQQSNDQPAQVIQTIISNSTNEVYPYLPSHDALRQ
ncbi:3990_t:CDS:1, partial [Funneliformis caledonium]